MDNSLTQGGLALILILMLFVYPALCINRIAARLGKPPTRYGLIALFPLGSLVALGLLAYLGPPHPPRRPGS